MSKKTQHKTKKTSSPLYQGNPRQLPIFDRNSKSIVKEKPYPRLAQFMWRQPLGSAVTELLLKHPQASWLTGLWCNCRYSRMHIARFVKQNSIRVQECEKSPDQFTSFNDFFTRKLKPHARPINKNPQALISPADCRMLAYPIGNNTVVPIKGKTIRVEKLLQAHKAAQPFHEGLCIVCRLAVSDYHRFCYVDDCRHGEIQKINGFYRAVHPLSLKNMKDVFCENRRQLTLLHTKYFGLVAHVDVGALLVGKIKQHFLQGTQAHKGQEKGFFEFGASTIILLLQPNRVHIDTDITQNTQRGIETRVLYGERIGTAIA